jgi:hypothetical protein
MNFEDPVIKVIFEKIPDDLKNKINVLYTIFTFTLFSVNIFIYMTIIKYIIKLNKKFSENNYQIIN